MFGVVLNPTGNEYGYSYSVFDKYTLEMYFLESDILFKNNDYTECEIWIADKLAEERIDAQNESELNALENQSVEY